MKKPTPMMQQYLQVKEENKDSIVFFRLGDFYEMFYNDAELASKELELTLTGKDCGLDERAPMCGVPFHSAENYIAKLISKGYKVAICEQVEDPKLAKGLVKRDVIRVITPGTVIEDAMLDEKKNNYIASIYYSSNSNRLAVAYCDVSTGKFLTTYLEGCSYSLLVDEIGKYAPSEIIYNTEFSQSNAEIIEKLKKELNITTTLFNDWAFETKFCIERIKSHFNLISLNSFGIEDFDECKIVCGALIEYLYQTQKISLKHISHIKFFNRSKYMVLDNTARRNLEITETLRDKARKGSLLWILDRTNTSMGARLLRSWIEQPLIDSSEIRKRLDAVEEIFESTSLLEQLKIYLNKIYDIERICGKISYGTVNPKDLIALKNSIYQLPDVKNAIKDTKTEYLKELHSNIDLLLDVGELLEKAIVDDPPFIVRDGGMIKDGYNEQVDEYRNAANNGKQWLAELEEKEKNETGIKNLKISYNKVFGFYIEVTKSNLDLVPERYIRKQTIANSERYITSELKEIEDKILGAQEKLVSLEYELFVEVRNLVLKNLSRIQTTANCISTLDGLYSLAAVAYSNNYKKPDVNDTDKIVIVGGRHPVVECMVGRNAFVANSSDLDCNDNMISLITGPNMAGKSTYMRQVALITLMAQIGSFVPAEEAHIGIVDRIFTRVGASDDLASGQSTFMVEMTEVSNILNNATKNSLLILDEIGRGTSTFDGMSIACAVLKHISEKIGAKTLFSTHYHELTALDKEIKGLKNYSIMVKEVGEDVIFLRKIIQKAANSSYGIQVAKLAGLPDEVIENAKEILSKLESENSPSVVSLDNVISADDSAKQSQGKHRKHKNLDNPCQLDIFEIEKINIINALKQIDVMAMTPMDCMNKLYELSKKAKEI